MSPAMDAALAGFNPTAFGAIEIVLPGYTLRLLDGSGIVTFDGKTFVGRDNTFGAIKAVDDLTDGTGDQAPLVRLTLIPDSDAAVAALASAADQGSPFTMWMGVVDPQTGLVIGEPLLVFLGELDVPTIKGGANSRLLELTATSVFEEFFFSDDGARLSDTYHQHLWPGETGLSQATGVQHQIYWGSDAPSGVTK